MTRFTCGYRCEECGVEKSFPYEVNVVVDEHGGMDADSTAKHHVACAPFREARDRAALEHAQLHWPTLEARWRRVQINGTHPVSTTCNCGGCRKETGR